MYSTGGALLETRPLCISYDLGVQRKRVFLSKMSVDSASSLGPLSLRIWSGSHPIYHLDTCNVRGSQLIQSTQYHLDAPAFITARQPAGVESQLLWARSWGYSCSKPQPRVASVTMGRRQVSILPPGRPAGQTGTLARASR